MRDACVQQAKEVIMKIVKEKLRKFKDKVNA